MAREFLMNKWVLSGVGFLILFSLSCFLWYQHETAPYKQDATETAEIVRQWEAEKAVAASPVEIALPYESADSRVSTTEKPTNAMTDADMRVPTADSTLAILTDQMPESATLKDVRVSPHGFGPYPKIPDGLPQGFFDRELSRDHELLGRVRIKLYEQGIPVLGISIDQSGWVYPVDKNQVYISWGETTLPGLGNVKYITGIEGDASVIREIENNARARDPKIPIPMQIEADIPTSVKVLDKSEEGFDAYAFLNLKR